MDERWVCILILITNLFSGILYFLFVKIEEKDTAKAFLGGSIILCTFGFGAIYLFLTGLYYNLVSRRFEKQVSMEELSFGKERKQYYNLEDVEEASNKVPIEEAVMVADKASARKTFLNILKTDYEEYIPLIYAAVSDRDSEISHYAATAIVDVVSRFKKKFEELAVECQGEGVTEEFVEFVSVFIRTGILSEHDCSHYTMRIEEIASKTEINSTIVYHMVMMYLYEEKPELARTWICRLEACKEKDLQSYKAILKYYFETKQQSLFMQEMDALKHSDIALDYQMLDLIRMYS